MKSARFDDGSHPGRIDLEGVSVLTLDRSRESRSIQLGQSSAGHGANTLLSLSPTELRSLRLFYQAFVTKDTGLLAQAVSSGWQDRPLAPHQPLVPADWKLLLTGLCEALSNLEIVVDEAIGNSDGVKVRARVTGRQDGALFSVPASGQTVTVLHEAFHRFKEGIIYETYRLEDWSGVSRRFWW